MATLCVQSCRVNINNSYTLELPRQKTLSHRCDNRSLCLPLRSRCTFISKHVKSCRRNLHCRKISVFLGDGVDGNAEPHDSTQLHILESLDVLGLGQAMVDFSGMVDDNFLEKLELEKGIRKVVNHEERGVVLQAMDGCSYKAAAGGSLSNTLVALARLGGGLDGKPPLKVAMSGSVGSDPLGHFYKAKLQKAHVSFLTEPIKDGTTGTVIVLTTPDAQRTMLSYQGMSSEIKLDTHLSSLIAKSKILVVEGYLVEFPQTLEAIAQACEVAHKNNVLVAITTSDVSCIARHHDKFWDIISHHADIVFANSGEAMALCGFDFNKSPETAARHLSYHSPLISVTDGLRGSYIAVRGEVIHIPPSPCVPVDSCGAGDAYAAGILYGLLKGSSSLKSIGNIASQVAAVVVGQQGTRLKEDDAIELTRNSFLAETKNTIFSWMVNQIRYHSLEEEKLDSVKGGDLTHSNSYQVL